jgi:hypothetical protein
MPQEMAVCSIILCNYLAGESALDEKVAMGLLMSMMNRGPSEGEEDRKGEARVDIDAFVTTS